MPIIICPKRYQTETYIPFENTKIRVPDCYEEILAKKYGENWKTPIRVGGLHDYPSYAKQQEFLKNAVDIWGLSLL